MIIVTTKILININKKNHNGNAWEWVGVGRRAMGVFNDKRNRIGVVRGFVWCIIEVETAIHANGGTRRGKTQKHDVFLSCLISHFFAFQCTL